MVRAVINADRDTSWRSVIHAFDLLKQGGLTQLAFGVVAVRSAP